MTLKRQIEALLIELSSQLDFYSSLEDLQIL